MMVIDCTSNAVSDKVASFDIGIEGDDAPLAYNKDPINEGQVPSWNIRLSNNDESMMFLIFWKVPILFVR